MRAAEQGLKQESIQDWNIHCNLNYSVKFNVRKKREEKKKKNQWALEKCYSFAAIGRGKNSGALCDGWFAKICVYRENKLGREKRLSLVLKVWLGKVHQENEGCFQELPLGAHFVRVRLGWSIRRLRGSLTQPARFQGSMRFCEAAYGQRSRIRTTNL